MTNNPYKKGSLNGQVDSVEVEVAAAATKYEPTKSGHGGARRYSQAYKQRILAEADRSANGELGALLRREGLYHSTLSKWREQQAAGRLDGSAQARKAAARVEAKAMAQLQRENARLKKELAQAEAIIAVQKKVAALLEAFDK
jgi:transposase